MKKRLEYTFGCTLCGTFDWWMWNWKQNGEELLEKDLTFRFMRQGKRMSIRVTWMFYSHLHMAMCRD